MTDLEITKLCAEAMGFEWNPHRLEARVPIFIEGTDKVFRRRWKPYDPLEDDAQAMALVKRFQLNIGTPFPRVWIPRDDGELAFVGMADDLNRAICECVAKMQADK